jgi:hypothetical protein
VGQAGSEVLDADEVVWDWKREQRFCGFVGLEEAQPAALETIGRAGGQQWCQPAHCRGAWRVR